MKPETVNRGPYDASLFTILCFLAVMVPIVYVPSGFQPYSLPKLLLIASAVLAAFAVIFAAVLEGRRLRFGGPTGLLVATYLGLAVLSAGLALDKTGALFGHFYRHDGLVTYLLFGTVFFVTVQISWSPERRRALLRSVLAGATLVALLAFLQYAGVVVFAGQSETSRVFATTGSPIFLGGYSALAAVVALASALSEQDKRGRSILFGLVALLAAVVILSASRSAVLGFAAGAIVVMALSARRRITARALVVAGLAVAAVLVFALFINFSRGGETLVSAVAPGRLLTAGASRLEMSRDGLNVLRAHALTGAGPSNFPWAAAVAGTDDPRPGGASWRFDDAHNVWIQTGASIGLPSLIILIIIIGIFFARSRRLAAQDPIHAAFAGGLATILVFASFQPMNVILHFPLWLFLAVVASSELGTGGKQGRKAIRLLATSGALILTVTVTFFLLKMVVADDNHKRGLEFRVRDQQDEAARRFERAAGLAPFIDEYQELLGDLRMQQGRALNSAESIRVGIAHLEMAAEIGPLDPENWGRLALAYQHFTDKGYGDRAREALEAAEEAVRVDPRSPYSRRALGAVLVSQGESYRAIEYLEAAVELDPLYSQGWLWLGYARETSGRLKEALDAYREALLSPDFEGAARQRMGTIKGKL